MFQQYFTQALPENILQQKGVLSVVSFEPRCQASSRIGVIPVGFDSLSEQPFEVLCYGDSVAQRGVLNDCHWSVIDDVICVSTWLNADDCKALNVASFQAYQKLFSVLSEKGFEYLVRAWNFMPNINSGDGDCEQYKLFCAGRERAFHERKLSAQQYPAASALGHHSEGAVIYLLASKKAVCHHENARQQAAYNYPREYGPSSPSFARATSINIEGDQAIFVSGTASIVGHKTQHIGNLHAQINTTIDNIKALTQDIDTDYAPLKAVRVYLRHRSDYVLARQQLSEIFDFSQTNFLLADICRENLLVEIEAASFKGKHCKDAKV